MLTSRCDKWNYTFDAQKLLQPQIIPHKEHTGYVLNALF